MSLQGGRLVCVRGKKHASSKVRTYNSILTATAGMILGSGLCHDYEHARRGVMTSDAPTVTTVPGRTLSPGE